MFLEPTNNSIGVSASVVINGSLGFVFAVEFESWEALNVKTSNFVKSGVDFNEENVRICQKSLRSFVVMWGEVFTMSTPWSIEFNKNFLVRIKNELFEVFANSNLNWLVIGFGDGGGFKILLNLSSLDFGDES